MRSEGKVEDVYRQHFVSFDSRPDAGNIKCRLKCSFRESKFQLLPPAADKKNTDVS